MTQVPEGPIETALWRCRRELANHRAAVVKHLESNRVARGGIPGKFRDRVVECRRQRRIFTAHEGIGCGGRGGDLPETIGGAQWQQGSARAGQRISQCAQIRNVVGNPETAPIGGDYEIVEMSLDLQPTYRRMRQRAVDFRPVLAVV